MSKLLTPEINFALDESPVVRTLEVPGRDDLLVDEVFPGQLVTSGDIRTKSFVLNEEDYGDEVLSIVDKAQPHAVFDLMVLSAGEEQVPGLAGHSPQFITRAMQYAARFAEFAKREGFYPVVSWSYDPLTDDRPTGQGEKRFHAHFMARNEADIETIHATKSRLGDLDSKSRRRIAEESSTIGGLVLADLLADEPFDALQIVPPFETVPSALSLQTNVQGGWEGLVTDGFVADFLKIDQAIHTYDAIVRSAVYEQTAQGHWRRPELKSDYALQAELLPDKMDLSSPLACHALTHYLKNMRRGLITDIENNRDKYDVSDIIHLYPLRSVSYTTCITEIEGILRAHFRVNLFTDLGGAGVSMVGGIPVKIKKGVGIMPGSTVSQRRQLQNQYLEAMGS